MNAFNFIDENTLVEILKYYRGLRFSVKSLRKVQVKSARIRQESSDDGKSLSRTPQVRGDFQALTATKKVKRVNVESGYKRRSFRLSVVFLILQFISVLLSYFIIIKDLMLEGNSQQLFSDIKTIHSISLLFQFDMFSFNVASAHLELPTEEQDGRLPARTRRRAAHPPRLRHPAAHSGLRRPGVPSHEASHLLQRRLCPSRRGRSKS